MMDGWWFNVDGLLVFVAKTAEIRDEFSAAAELNARLKLTVMFRLA